MGTTRREAGPGVARALVSAELESESYWAAIAVADRMLLYWPGDKTATNARTTAVKRLREQADSLLPHKPKS